MALSLHPHHRAGRLTVLLHHLRVIPLLVRMYIRSQMEYRGAFWLDRLAQILSYGSVFATIAILLARFDTLGGWSWPELALLYSFQLLAYSLGAAMSFTQLRDLEELVRLGTYDALLVKPFSPWVYLIFSGLNIGYAGHIILAVPLLGWAVFSVDFAWSVPSALFLVAALVSATLLTAALITMIGATALIWVRSNHLFSIFFGFWELMRYPLNIFPGSIQITLLTAVPLALTSSVPVAALLGKPVPILGDWAGPAALAAGPVWVLIAMAYWRYATGKYQGAGG
ncbi:ABC-2 family transporter protein [Rhizobium sp. CCGE 510]|uniref:ABC transporter permease n=1 Tax=Rhizobium sp. CCGE 510 TaxID=1132836 RepID=UPI00178C1BEC|nr:ABC-2 family transporter protein [Rhizobium sp. CCGE 510]